MPAILAYNGLDRRNDPAEAEEVYQEDVYSVIENNSLLGSSSIDVPEWNAVYENGEDRIRFEEQEVKTDTKTPSTQMAENGDDIYTYGEDPGTQVNYRLGPSTTSRIVGDISLYTPLQVEGTAAHDNSPTNHFVYYPVHYADIRDGYMASAYARSGSITNFYDVRRQELTEAVGYLEVRGILSGYPGGEFRPNESILRRHAASMMVDALNLEAPDEYDLQASDMEAGDRGYDALRILEYHGIMTGSNGNIRPNENMTRAQTASILTAGFENTLKAPADSHSFEDISEDFWNYAAINTLYHNEVTTVEAFRPNEDLKRSQFALFLKAAMTK
ncbi:S-layer homology domain-containing protein [Salibacterium halotolerans]|uniref:S-layer homology domain-containing protein n=1 Tax=Salibacterium halotolerans TaxID=1884432 RepID=A0A1I5WWK8_9BACI|nr:S-layer homology domain-containing protein [Salibacterium halotolerans]SFQ23916.1 S-layer homology domain-containing protein [Salibacterium halotolerans]